MSQTLAKLSTAEFAKLNPHLSLSPEATAVTEGCAQVADALARLEAAGFLTEATRLMAHALPKRDEVAEALALEYPESGGHLGFVSGRFPGQLNWLPRRILSFLGGGDQNDDRH